MKAKPAVARIGRILILAVAVSVAPVFAIGPAVTASASIERGSITTGATNQAVAASTPTIANSPVASSAKPWGARMRAFTQCVFGVGIPAGVAVAIVTNPAVAAWIVRKGPWPASVGGTASKYLGWIKSVCGYALIA